ncbi:MAG: carbohydrate kinase [Halobacteriales archaeon]
MTDPEALVAGEVLIDFIPETPGPLATVESFTRRPGGAPANVAVGLARLDRTPWFCTALSTDPFGQRLRTALTEEGIPERYFTTEADRRTALAFVAHDETGDREFTFYRDDTADTHLDTGVVPDATLDSVAAVVVGGVTLTVEPARSATLDLIERASEGGCTVVFDPNERPELWDPGVDRRETIERALAGVDVLKASREDLAELGIEPGADSPEELLDHGPHAAFLTRGSEGAELVAGEGSPWGAGAWDHPGYEPDGVVDATGAGDAFTAGVVAALVDGEGPAETLAVANAVAAAATTARGAMTALPDRDAVERLRADRG